MRHASNPRRFSFFAELSGCVGCGILILGAFLIGLASATAASLTDRSQFRRPPIQQSSDTERAAEAVGRALFLSTELSADRTLNCLSCHQPENAWRDGRGRSLDRAGNVLPRRSPSLSDLAWAAAFAWDGRSDTLETQSLDPVLNPRIGGLTAQGIVDRVNQALEADPVLRGQFEVAFGNGRVTIDRVAAALAAYERTIVSPIAPFDRWVEGDEDALSLEARRGFALFTGRAGCAACHSGWRLTDDSFHDIGLPDRDLGRGRLFPGEPTLQHAFKTPTLRGIRTRGPFMHDGSLLNLDDVLTHYEAGFLARPSLDPDLHRFTLSAQERSDLTAFLLSLSDVK